ncbi:MAG TPA: FG-GAP-like repeat-containing protein [Candidatus Angelobacter sp.]|jgi:hypothetical protein
MQSRTLAVLVAASLLATSALTATAQTINFSQQRWLTGPRPTGVVSGDFNRDGNPDLAVTDNQANRVTIILNQGGGHFAFGADYPAGSEPHQLVSADFNHDGILDLAIANSGSGEGTVTILLGNGNGTFRAGTPVDIGAGNNAVAIGAADFNHSGIPQLAVVQCDPDTDCGLRIYRSDGTGVFSLAQIVTLASGTPTFGEVFSLGLIAIDDFNLDGRPDVAVANSNQVFVFTDTSTGKLQQHTTITPNNTSSIEALAAGHFNGDAGPDLVIRVFDNSTSTNRPNSEVVYLNSGTGSFTLRSRISGSGLLNFGGPTEVGDVSGNLIDDIISASGTSQNSGIQYALGIGDGFFRAPVAVTDNPQIQSSPGGLVLRDLNLDSRRDILITSRSQAQPAAFIYLNTSAPTNCRPPGSANLAVNICTPASNATVASQFTVSASGNSPAGVKRLEVWVDGTKRTQHFSDQLRATVSLTHGTHQLTVVGVDLYDAIVKKTITVHAP